MENTNALVVRAESTAPVIEVNFDELKARAEEMAAQYTAVAITEETYKAAKADAKELAGKANEIEKRRKEIKKQLEAPIKDFEQKCKEVARILTDAKAEIEKQTDLFDEKRREEKRRKAEAEIAGTVKALGLTEKYAARLTVDPSYINLTCTQKAMKADVNARGLRLQREQALEEAVTASAGAAVEAANSTIEQKLSLEDTDVRLAVEKAVEDASASLDDPAAKPAEAAGKAVAAAVAALAARIRAAEMEVARKARERAEAELRERLAREAAEKAAAEKAQAGAAAQAQAAQDGPAQAAPAGFDVPAPSAGGPGLGFDLPGFDVPAAPKEPRYEMGVRFTGEYGSLKAMGEELKALCAKHGVDYEVLRDQFRKAAA